MTATHVSDPTPPSALRRAWFPMLALVAAPLLLAGLYFWPDLDALPWDRRTSYATIGLMACITALLAWVLVASRWPWAVRLGTLAAVAGILLGSVKKFHFTGDFLVVLQYRWESSNDETVERHRQQAREAAAAPVAISEGQADYTEYRGRQRDGILLGPALRRDWKENPPRELWRQPVGGGYAGFVVAGNLAVTLEQRRGDECIVGYDAATGRELWKHSYPAQFEETMGGPGPRATPTLAEGKVYSLGASGKLVCLDAVTGKLRWEVDTLKDNENVRWGMSGSPLVYDGLVVVHPGAQIPAAKGKALVAYDCQTGELRWSGGDHRTGYASPMLATLGGLRQILLFDADGLAGHDAKSGQELWRYPWPTYQGISVAQPLVLSGDRVFISAGYGHGCVMLQVKTASATWSVEEVWKSRALHCKFTSPVALGDHLYGLDDGILVCVDARTGKRTWKENRYKHGQLLRSEDLLVIFSEDGKLVLVEVTPDQPREIAQVPVFNAAKNWNHLAIANGKAYLRNHLEMACLELER